MGDRELDYFRVLSTATSNLHSQLFGLDREENVPRVSSITIYTNNPPNTVADAWDIRLSTTLLLHLLKHQVNHISQQERNLFVQYVSTATNFHIVVNQNGDLTGEYLRHAITDTEIIAAILFEIYVVSINPNHRVYDSYAQIRAINIHPILKRILINLTHRYLTQAAIFKLVYENSENFNIRDITSILFETNEPYDVLRISNLEYVTAGVGNVIYILELSSNWLGIFQNRNPFNQIITMYQITMQNQEYKIRDTFGTSLSSLHNDYKEVQKFEPYVDDNQQNIIMLRIKQFVLFISKVKSRLRDSGQNMRKAVQFIFDPDNPISLAEPICNNVECHNEALFEVAGDAAKKYCGEICFELDYKK